MSDESDIKDFADCIKTKMDDRRRKGLQHSHLYDADAVHQMIIHKMMKDGWTKTLPLPKPRKPKEKFYEYMIIDSNHPLGGCFFSSPIKDLPSREDLWKAECPYSLRAESIVVKSEDLR